MKDFSSRLEQLRGAQTQRAFARRLGIPLNTYTNWVRGINNPRTEQLQKICTECNISMESLLGTSTPNETPLSVAEESLPCYDQASEIAKLRADIEELKLDIQVIKKLIIK